MIDVYNKQHSHHRHHHHYRQPSSSSGSFSGGMTDTTEEDIGGGLLRKRRRRRFPFFPLNSPGSLFGFSVSLLVLLSQTEAIELTFELPDNAKECFYEVIQKDTEATLEYQVVTGGQYDVDVLIMDPRKRVLYKEVKKQYDSHSWKAEMTGEYTVCFSNEFSTFSHKLVYLDFQVGDEDPLPGIGEHITAMTQMESSSQEIHENLNAIIDYQTHHRLRETQGRRRAEDLNDRVMIWSAFVTVAILVVGIGQVVALKSFFSEKKPSQLYGYH